MSEPTGIQPAPSSTMRSTFLGVSARPNQIGRPPACTGRGMHQRSSNETVGEWNDAGASRQSTRQARSTSSMRAARDFERNARRRELLGLPADSDAEIDATTRERVERRERLGEQRRRAQWRDQHRRREADPPGRARHRRERHDRLGPRLVVREWEPAERIAVGARADQQVIGHRDLVDASVLGALREIDQLREIVAEEALHARDGERDRKAFAHAAGATDFIRAISQYARSASTFPCASTR